MSSSTQFSESEGDENPSISSSDMSGVSSGGGGPEALYDDLEDSIRRLRSTSSNKSATSQLLLRKTATAFEQGISKNELLKETEEVEDRSSVTVLLEGLYNLLYPHFFLDKIWNVEALKVAVRTCLCLWITLVFMIIPSIRTWMGNAPYLPMILVFIVAPGGRSFADLFYTGIYTLMGTVVAWLYTVISQAISMRLRKIKFDSSLELAQYLIEEGLCENDAASLSTCVSAHCFQGRFLEARSSVINALSIGFGVFFFFEIKIRHRVLTIPCILALIALLITCTYSNYFPYMEAVVLLGNIFFRSYGIALSLMFVLSLILFPVTSQYKVLKFTLNQLDLLSKFFDTHVRLMNTVPPSDDKFGDVSELREIMRTVRQARIPISQESRFIYKEFSYLRLKASDVSEWVHAVNELSSAVSGIEYFYLNILNCKKRILYSSLEDLDDFSIYKDSEDPPSYTVGYNELKKRFEAYKAYLQSDSNLVNTIKSMDDLNDLMEVVRTHFLDSVYVSNDALQACYQWMSVTNRFRVLGIIPYFRKKYVAELKECSDKLKELRNRMNCLLKVDSNEWKDIMSKDKNHLILPTMGQSALFGFIMESKVKIIDKLCGLIEEWDEKQPLPTINLEIVAYFYGFLKNPKHLISSFFKTLLQFTGTLPIRERDPDSYPPTTHIGALVSRMARTYTFITNKTPFFLGIKTAIAIVLVTMPAYFPSTAFQFYSHRWVWIPIMASIGVSSDTFESAYQLFVKILSTFFGTFVGACAWYISTGNGRGNYYGLGAVCAVCFFVMTYYRHFSVYLTPMPAIVPNVTFTLVIGTSWQDAKGQMPHMLHWGVITAYSRFVAVVIGCTLAFLITVFPRITSGSKKLRLSISQILKEIAQLHCEVNDSAMAMLQGEESSESSSKIAKHCSEILLMTSTAFSVFKRMKYDIQLKGKWPKKKYERLIQTEVELVKLYYLLSQCIESLEDKSWLLHILDRLGWNDEEFCSLYFSVIYISFVSLGSGNALPWVVSSELSLKHLNLLMEQGLGDPFYGSDNIYIVADDQNEKSNRSTDVSSSKDSNDQIHINFDALISHDGRNNMISIILMHTIYEKIDNMMFLIKSLVGEEFSFRRYQQFDTETEL